MFYFFYWFILLETSVAGDVVYSAGYGLFCTPSDARVNIAKGVISNSNEFMIMTTCSVHPGASGGAIMSPRGKLVGVIVCNTKLFESNATFPRINMAIPVTAIFRIIQEFLINEGNFQRQRMLYLNIRPRCCKSWVCIFNFQMYKC